MIRATDLYKAFGPKRVLQGVSFDVARGESLVVIGGSGTGKSVLLKCLLGLEHPDRGMIEIAGLNRPKPHELAAHVGMLFQGSALFDSLPVWQNVAFRLLRGPARMGKAEARAVAEEKLARVGLGAEVGELFPAELSGGMQKRVGLARAIATEPEIIFFDEPTTGLDPIMADVINDLIVSSVKELGATTLSITHDMASVRKIADRVAMIYKGKIIWSGTRAEVDASGNEYVDQFIHGRAEGPIQMEVLKP